MLTSMRTVAVAGVLAACGLLGLGAGQSAKAQVGFAYGNFGPTGGFSLNVGTPFYTGYPTFTAPPWAMPYPPAVVMPYAAYRPYYGYGRRPYVYGGYRRGHVPVRRGYRF